MTYSSEVHDKGDPFSKLLRKRYSKSLFPNEWYNLRLTTALRAFHNGTLVFT